MRGCQYGRHQSVSERMFKLVVALSAATVTGTSCFALWKYSARNLSSRPLPILPLQRSQTMHKPLSSSVPCAAVQSDDLNASSALRTLMKRRKQQAADSMLEQALGLEGGLRRSLLGVVVWLAAGTAFYMLGGGFEELNKTSVAASFFYAVDQGLSIGSGVLTPKTESAILFNIFFILFGAVLAANVLSTFISDAIDETQKKQSMRLVIKDDTSALNNPITLPLGLLILWWLVGVLFGCIHEGWSWTQALFFAVSATSTAGVQGLDSKDDLSFVFGSIYSLVGVPLYAATVGRLGFVIAEPMIKNRRNQLKSRATDLLQDCDEACALELFEMFDADNTGAIDRDEVVPLIKFLGNAQGMVVTDDDIAFMMTELGGVDGDSEIPKSKFLESMNRLSKTATSG